MKRQPLFKVVDRTSGHEYGLFCQRDAAEAKLAFVARISRRQMNLLIREVMA